MNDNWNINNVQLLTDKPVPELVQAQLALFDKATMHVEHVMGFDVRQAAGALNNKAGKRVVAADFGGDKGTSHEFVVDAGKLVTTSDYTDTVQGNDGEGYLASLQKSVSYATEHDLPIGISWGGPMEGSKLLFHPKATTFFNELQAAYGGDLRALSPNVAAVLNDGPAGVISGAVEAYRQYGAETVLFIINGGGIGLGVLKDDQIWSTEAGHIEGLAELNTYQQTATCGVFDATYTCLERLGANKAGIEAQWEAKTGTYMRARNIEDEYKAGDVFAAELYDHSAWVVAHILQGAAQGLGIDLADSKTAIVGHGGAFKFPEYGERIKQILETANTSSVQLLLTKDYSADESNACLDGAAIAALLA